MLRLWTRSNGLPIVTTATITLLVEGPVVPGLWCSDCNLPSLIRQRCAVVLGEPDDASSLIPNMWISFCPECGHGSLDPKRATLCPTCAQPIGDPTDHVEGCPLTYEDPPNRQRL